MALERLLRSTEVARALEDAEREAGRCGALPRPRLPRTAVRAGECPGALQALRHARRRGSG